MATKGLTPEERRKLLGITSGSGTTEGTDDKSAEKNLRQEYETRRAEEREKKARESYEKAPTMKRGGKVKKYADGGNVDLTQQPTYPFYGNTPQASTTQPGMTQTFNIQPTATAGQPQGMKKGGAVKSSASKRGDGCAMRGKTRGRMV